MTTVVPLVSGSYVARDPHVSCKRLVNFFSEVSPQTSLADTKQIAPPLTIRRAPGIPALANDGTGNPTRGFRTMRGITYVVIGPTLYQMASNGTLTQIGTGIPGTSFVRMCDNTQCLFILVPGTSIAYTYCPNGTSGFALFTDPTFLSYGAIDIGYIDTYFVFLQANGRGFYNDDGQITSGVNVPTFNTFGVFPREFGTDVLRGMCVDHREVILFGDLTSEGYVDAGIATGSPFISAPDAFMEIGVHPSGGYTIVSQDQSVFWVASDRTVRRRNGQTPVRVSNSGIEAVLETADLTGAYAMAPSIGGHPWYVLTLPAIQRTLVFDCLTTEWFELDSYNIGNWRPLCWYNAFGRQLVGDSLGSGVGYLDTTVYTEFGQPMQSVFTTQAVYDRNNRIAHRRLELMITAGGTTSFTTDPRVTLFVSDDGGYTFVAGDEQSLGVQGQHNVRLVWWNLGQSRNRVYRFQITEASPSYVVDIFAELDGGKW